MDILFIFPTLKKEESYSEIKISNKAGGFLPPLGVAMLSAYLIEHKFEVGILDPIIEGMALLDIINYVKEKNPAVIAFSSVTPTFQKSQFIAEKIREQFPDKLILIGGHHISLFKENTVERKTSFDIFVYGEGELTVVELMTFLKNHNYNRNLVIADITGLTKIAGIMFKHENQVYRTKSRPLIPNLDILPMPARHLLKMERYIPLPIEYKKLPAVHMMISRGCPFSCTYCATHGAFGYKVRYKSPEVVIEEIKHVIDKYGARQISFWDDVLTINKAWLIKLCNLMLENKLNIIWNCYAHANTVNDELLKKMKEAGCFCIWYGIESGDDMLLKVINKGTTVEGIKKAVKLTKKNGIEVRGLFMVGLPKETPELAQKTINFAKELDLDYAQFSITTPHIGTSLYEMAEQYGTLEKNYDKYTQHEAVFVPFGYKSKEQIEEIAKRAFKEFYHRPSYVFKQLVKIRNSEDLKRYYKAFKIAVGF